MTDCLFLSQDLLFSSRVAGTARSCGVSLTVVPQTDLLMARAENERVALVLLDLSFPHLNPVQLVPQLRRSHYPPGQVIAFGPHVHENRLAVARRAGCDEVLTRGAFHRRIAELLSRLSPPEVPSD